MSVWSGSVRERQMTFPRYTIPSQHTEAEAQKRAQIRWSEPGVLLVRYPIRSPGNPTLLGWP